jgi:hypothetical protein
MSSYQIYQFDGVALPLYNPEQDLSTGGVDSTLLASVGGTFDVWSGWRRLPRIVRHTVSGIYAAPDGTAYIVDHAGNQIVDHAGNAIIAGTAQALLRGQVDAIRAELGFVGPLWRRRWDDPAVAQWKAARLVAVQEKSDIKHRTIAAKLDCVFESAQAAWRDASIDTVSGSLTSLRFEILHLGIDLRYTGTLPVGAVLQIDCGTQAVTVNGAAAYSGFALGSGHTARGWMPLPPGMWPLQVASNGAGTVSSSHYDQWV